MRCPPRCSPLPPRCSPLPPRRFPPSPRCHCPAARSAPPAARLAVDDNRTRRGVGQRTRPFIELERTGRDSNPLDLSIVCHVLRTGSRVWFGDRRGGESETLRCSTIELRHASTSGDFGIRTGHRPKGGHTRLFKHVLQFSSRSYCGGDEGWSELGPSCTPSSQLGLYCDRPTKG